MWASLMSLWFLHPTPILKICTTPSVVESADCVKTTEKLVQIMEGEGREQSCGEGVGGALAGYYGAQSDQVNFCNPQNWCGLR